MPNFCIIFLALKFVFASFLINFYFTIANFTLHAARKKYAFISPLRVFQRLRNGVLRLRSVQKIYVSDLVKYNFFNMTKMDRLVYYVIVPRKTSACQASSSGCPIVLLRYYLARTANRTLTKQKYGLLANSQRTLREFTFLSFLTEMGSS